MKLQTLALPLSLVLAVGTAVHANNGGTEPDAAQAEAAPAKISIDVDSLVAGRRAGYWMSANLFGGMFGIVQGGGQVTGMEGPARSLARWATALPEMFPEGSMSPRSNALPTIWSEREEFEAIAALYAERATELSAYAKAADTEGFKTQWALVRETCVSCHSKFRRDRSGERAESEQ